jgi:signal transduction histidine kinase
MRALGSLSNRLFLVCVLLATASIGAAMLFVSARLTREHERAMTVRLDETITLVERQRRQALETSARLARLVADLPKLKAAIATGDGPTVAPIVSSYREEIGADVLIVRGADGVPLYTAGDVRGDVAGRRAPAASAPAAAATVSTLAHPRGVLQVVSVPIVIGFDPVERLGLLSVGMLLDDEQARQFRASTGSELAFAMGPRVLASSLGASAALAIEEALARNDDGTLQVGPARYSWHTYALESMSGEGAKDRTGARLVVLRSTAEADATLRSVRVALAVIAVLTALVASLASYAVARTITRPLASLTTSMREMTRTGDLTRRPQRTSGHAWDDEDVRVLAGTFDAMTEAIARFQQQAAERDRLTALGRLSTIVAHEIRNPLMIVRGALRGLRRQNDPTVADAAADIEEQVQRLDRVVNDVLDFARPVQLSVAPASLHAICREAVAACIAAEPEPAVVLDLAADADDVRTDADRLRSVLVNVVANARQAVRAARREASSGDVVLAVRRAGRAVVIDVRDTGVGIEPGVVSQVFEPYFTTRRTGTGLGLAIARNIVEGLGGTIELTSRPGEGTDVRLTLPQEELQA